VVRDYGSGGLGFESLWVSHCKPLGNKKLQNT